MKILILGYSDLSKRKIIPTLKKNFKNIRISISSNSKSKIDNIEWYNNYEEALKKSKADIVYISTHNSKHYFWAKKSLNYNYHVIIDKPITLNHEKTIGLICLAKKKNKLLAEATVFNFHKQIQYIIKEINSNKEFLKIFTRFTIPLLPKKNFRRNLKLGGGCVNDMGSYAASIYRIFCKEKIKKKYFLKINKIFRKNLNESFEIIIKGKKFEYIGYFSHNSKYENKLKLIKSKKIYEIDRVFSPPSNKSLILKIKNQEKKIQKLVRFKHDIFDQRRVFQ